MNNRYMYAVLALVMACGDTNGGDSGGGSDQDSDTDDLVVEDDTGDIVEEPVDDDRDGFSVDEDCDDTNADISPAAQEVCDGIDNDCDGDIDDADDSLDAGDDGVVVYTDADADGFGDPETERRVCVMGDVQVSTAGDCDDRDEDVNPSGEERCDGVDNDCNGEIDEIIFIDESALSDVTTGVQLNGSSFLDEFGNIVLTLNTPNTAGSVLYQDTVPGDTWAATFEIYSGNPLQNSQGGDGMAFVFYDASKTDATFVGTSGGYLGADNPGVVGYAVEFDTYDNGTALGDPDGNHIAIVATDERPLRTLAAASSRDGVPLLDDSETIHRVQVVMREGTVEVSINDVTLLTHTIAGYNLSSLRMGFTAGTGSIVNFHVVASAKVECVP